MNKLKRISLGKTVQALKKKVAHFRRTLTTSAAELGLLGLALSSVVYAAVPGTAFADVKALTADQSSKNDAIALQIAAMKNTELPYGELPVSDPRGPSYTIRVTATAYNSLPGQTDSTPFITAAGTHTRWGVVAANFLPMGTKIRIPDVYGDQIFVVEDRMNPRYYKRLDVWMENYSDAKQFGVRQINIEVYK